MATETITIHLDSEAAGIFRSARPEGQQKIEARLGSWLKEIAATESLSLKEVVGDIGRTAQERGLTPDALESLLGPDQSRLG